MKFNKIKDFGRLETFGVHLDIDVFSDRDKVSMDWAVRHIGNIKFTIYNEPLNSYHSSKKIIKL